MARLFGLTYASSGVAFSLKADGVNGRSGVLPMSVAGARPTASLSAPMTAWNDQLGASLSVDMTVAGYGTSAGGLPASTSMNLHIMRWPSLSADFSLAGVGTAASGGPPCFLKGSAPASGSVPFSLGGVGVASGAVPLHVRGF